eukprot:1832084-Prymnesium_polylepis.3
MSIASQRAVVEHNRAVVPRACECVHERDRRSVRSGATMRMTNGNTGNSLLGCGLRGGVRRASARARSLHSGLSRRARVRGGARGDPATVSVCDCDLSVSKAGSVLEIT